MRSLRRPFRWWAPRSLLVLARRLVEDLLDLGHGLLVADLVHSGDFARHAVEGRLIELALGIGLSGWRSERKRSRTTSATAIRSPELIFASYS